MFRNGKASMLSALAMFLVAGCSPHTSQEVQKTQLQIREFQTKVFDEIDLRTVMKTMLNVLQDEGFIVKSVSLELGFASVTKEVDVEKSQQVFWSKVLQGEQARWTKQQVLEGTINVTEYGQRMSVRVNFQSKVLDNRGMVIKIQQIEDEKYYQEFFSKVDKGLFIQKQNL